MGYDIVQYLEEVQEDESLTNKNKENVIHFDEYDPTKNEGDTTKNCEDFSHFDETEQDNLSVSSLETFHMPVLPLRGVLVFPHSVMQLDVGREKSIKAINEALSYESKEIILAMQKDIHIDDPGLDDIYATGTIATIKQVIRPSGGTLRIIVEGVDRAEIVVFVEHDTSVETNTAGNYRFHFDGGNAFHFRGYHRFPGDC